VGLYARALLRMDVARHADVPQGPVILVANHPSTTDPFLMVTLFQRQVSILVEERMFRVPVFGLYLRHSGHIPVPACNGRVALDRGLRLLSEGRAVGIFPEGLISPLGGGFHRPHTGAARLALASGAPIVPIGIHLDRTRLHCVVSSVRGELAVGVWYLRGPYAVTVGEPMRFGGSVDDHEQVRAISRRVMQRVIQLSDESSHRMTSGHSSAGPVAQQPASAPETSPGSLR